MRTVTVILTIETDIADDVEVRKLVVAAVTNDDRTYTTMQVVEAESVSGKRKGTRHHR